MKFSKQRTDWYLQKPPVVGDLILGEGTVVPGFGKMYGYEVLEVENLKRFGSENYLFKVNVFVVSFSEVKYLETTLRWVNQLF